MKTLNNHVILYDNACPMCSVYTKGFIKAGMLSENGRAPYQDLHGDLKKLVDCSRAVNEIALVDKSSGVVHYGVQSLFLIIGNSFPVFKLQFRCKLFAWLANKAYKTVSYNRRVIVPSVQDSEKREHQPLFKRSYRLFYLLGTWLATAFILFQYNKNMASLLPAGAFYMEFAVCGGQIIWQGLIITALDQKKCWDYLGNMMTVSFAGGLLLLAGMGILKSFLVTDPLIYALYFIGVAGLMFLEHVRRTRLLQISGWLTVSWVLYRFILLFIIL